MNNGNNNGITLPRIESSKSQQNNKYELEFDPTLKKLPSHYQSAYQNYGMAKSLINSRLDRLNYEKELLRGMNVKERLGGGNRNIGNLFNYNNLSGAMSNKRNLMNPNLYSHQFMDPIYYPLEMPVNGEPISLPKIELGQPLQDPNENKNNGLGLSDILAIIGAMKNANGGNNNDYNPPKRKETPLPMEDLDKKKPELKPIKKPGPKSKKDYWKLVRAFTNIYKYYSIANKYAKHANVRNPILDDLTKAIYGHIDTIKNWVILIEQPFFEEFKVFPDLNLSFNNFSGKLKIQEQSQKIIALINIFIKNLILKSSKSTDIPDKIQLLIYKYIRERAYFPRKYLSTFEINRLDFNFYGGLKNNSDAAIGMIVAFLIISRVTVQQILLHPIQNFEQFKNFRYIQLSCKFVGSILHYLVKDAFKASPPMVKDILALHNYYRNYHIYNEQIEKNQDIFNNNITYRDVDELSDNLVPENTISNFFSTNAKWVEGIKKYIYQWAVNLGKFIKMRHSRYDKNLEKPLLKRPDENVSMNEGR